MNLTNDVLEKLITPKPDKHTTRLPKMLARKNAALIAFMISKGRSVK